MLSRIRGENNGSIYETNFQNFNIFNTFILANAYKSTYIWQLKKKKKKKKIEEMFVLFSYDLLNFETIFSLVCLEILIIFFNNNDANKQMKKKMNRSCQLIYLYSCSLKVVMQE